MPSFPDDIKFSVVKEDWNEYKLQDETILRTKIVLIKAVRDVDPRQGIGYNFNTQNHVAVFTSSDKKGTPGTKPYTPQELQASVVDEIDFEVVKEDWNSYQLEDGARIDIKLILTRVAKTDKFDPMGSPIYLTQTQTVIKPKIPKELQKKIISTSKTTKTEQKGTTYTV
jgi:hypothetical protein